MEPAHGSRPVTYKSRYVTLRFNKLFPLKNRITGIVFYHGIAFIHGYFLLVNFGHQKHSL